MQYEELMNSDLRDSGGHQVMIVRIASFDQNYTMGGLVLNAADFGLESIEFIHLQSITALQDSAETPAVIASMQTAMKFADAETGAEYWKLFVFVPDTENGGFMELPDGSAMEFPPELRIVLMLTGA